MSRKLGFIGCGNMAQAIIGGVLRANIDSIINVYDIDSQKCNVFTGNTVNISDDINSLIYESDYVFLAVKPQHIQSVFEQITSDLSDKIIISILAGVSTDYIRKLAHLPDLRVVRVMPNTPLLVGEGATALCKTENVTIAEFEFIEGLFASSGKVAQIYEEQMNDIININGSSPAYIFLFTMAVMEYAKKCNIDENTALELFSQTLIGSAHMMLESGKTPQQLKEMVTSPGGTTLAALNVFDDEGFVDIILRAFDACTKRAKELGK